MTVPFKSLSFSRELLSDEKLNQLANNDEWLKERMPITLLDHEGLKKDTQLKILAGSSLVQPQRTWSQRSSIYFGNYFQSMCKPIVVAEIYSYPQMGLNWTVHGIGNKKIPDNRGISLYIWADDRGGTRSTLNTPMVVGYIAIGY